MEKKIDDAKMTPEYFQDQFKLICKQHLDPPFDVNYIITMRDDFIREAGDIFDEFVRKLNEISATTLDDPSFSKLDTFDAGESVGPEGSDYLLKGSAYVLDAFGFLRLGGILFDVGGAFLAGGSAWLAAGGIGGGTVAIGKAATGIWAALAASGPAGWIIAGAATVVGIGGGWGLKKLAERKEKKKLKEAVSNALPDLKKKITEYIVNSQQNTPEQFDQVLDNIEKIMSDKLICSIELIHELEKPLQERQADILQLENEIHNGNQLLATCRSI